MPTTELNLPIDALRRLPRSHCDLFFAEEYSRSLREWLGATLAYAVAIAVVAGSLAPAFLHSHPVAAFLPKPPPTVERSPHLAPGPEAAL